MNAAKLDPLLVKTLREEAAPQRYPVMIRVSGDPDAAQWAVLARHGVARPPRPSRTLTASLARDAIAALSNEGWVETIRLAPASRPLG
jgi:hypothetical protein